MTQLNDAASPPHLTLVPYTYKPPVPRRSRRQRAIHRCRVWWDDLSWRLRYDVLGAVCRRVAWRSWREAAYVIGFEEALGAVRRGTVAWWCCVLAEHDHGYDAGCSAAEPWILAHDALPSRPPVPLPRWRAAARRCLPVSRAAMDARVTECRAEADEWETISRFMTGRADSEPGWRPSLALVTAAALSPEE